MQKVKITEKILVKKISKTPLIDYMKVNQNHLINQVIYLTAFKKLKYSINNFIFFCRANKFATLADCISNSTA